MNQEEGDILELEDIFCNNAEKIKKPEEGLSQTQKSFQGLKNTLKGLISELLEFYKSMLGRQNILIFLS